MKDAGVRACVSSIVRSPFVREDEISSPSSPSSSSSSSSHHNPNSPTVGGHTISFSLRAGPSPSLCLSAASFEAMATVLKTMLSMSRVFYQSFSTFSAFWLV
jgi:hypothetical protein